MDSRIDENNPNRRILTPTELDIDDFLRRGSLVVPLYFLDGPSIRGCFINLSAFSEPELQERIRFNPQKDLLKYYWYNGEIKQGRSNARITLATGRITSPRERGVFDSTRELLGLSCHLGLPRKNKTYELKLNPEYK